MKLRTISLLSVLALSVIVACKKSGETKAPGAPQAETPAATAENPDAVVAKMKDGVITAKELNDLIKVQLKAAENKHAMEIYEIKNQAVEKLIQDRLLAAKAKASGKSEQDIIKEEVLDKVQAPTDAEVKAYYDQAKAQNPNVPPLNDAIKAQIADQLKRQKTGPIGQAFLAKLKEEAKVEVFLSAPRFNVTASGTSKGPKDAPITLITISDYECPYCGRAEETVKEVLKAYPGKIKLVFNDFPLPMHEHAQKAAEAAHCAEDQGKYWEMHDKLFSNQKALTIGDLKGYAKGLGLDTAKFDKCLDSGEKEKMIKDSVAAAEGLGFSSTPMFFVNGVLIQGAQPLPVFKEAIDRELAKK